MKKLIFLFVSAVIATAFVGCKDKQSESDEAVNTDSIERALLQDSLNIAKAERDTLMSLVSEVNQGLSEIKQLQDIVSTMDVNSETPSRKEQLLRDIDAIKAKTQERINRLNALENKLAQSEHYNEELRNTITLLRQQLSDQQTKIDELSRQLEQVKQENERLNKDVDSLKSENTEVNREKERAEKENERLTNQLNECYYVVGTNKELKQHKIIEGGFLRKTKIMEGEFQRNYFTQADKRYLNEIPLHSRKAKVWSKHPEGSYQLVDVEGQKVLRITNAARFWELSNYLVVQVN